jgi:hypothetical protein
MTNSKRNRSGERGVEILEFGLVLILFIPLLLGGLVTGMNLIRSIQNNQMCRDLADMYIHGADFSTQEMQQLAARLSQGLYLDVSHYSTATPAINTGNQGNGLVTISQIMYVGATTDGNCASLTNETCTNHDSFVFTQRIRFGNGTLASSAPSLLGDPSTTEITSLGVIKNPLTDAGARVPEPQQSNMRSLWQVSGGGRTPLQDGQVSYVVETFFGNPDLGLGSFPGGGVYAKYFF